MSVNTVSPFLPELCHSLAEKSVSALPHLIAYSIFNEQKTLKYIDLKLSYGRLTIAPIGRFLEFLKNSGNLEDHMQTLRKAFNPLTGAAPCHIRVKTRRITNQY